MAVLLQMGGVVALVQKKGEDFVAFCSFVAAFVAAVVVLFLLQYVLPQLHPYLVSPQLHPQLVSVYFFDF